MKYFSSILLMAALFGCAKSGGSSPNSNPVDTIRETGKTIDLQGKTFESETCRDPIVLKLFSAKGYKIRYMFRGNNVVRTTLYYPSSTCDGDVAFTFDESGTFERKNPSVDGSYEIDMHFNKLEAIANSEQGKQFAERDSMGACGRKVWTRGEKVEVTSQAGRLNCYNHSVPNTVYDIYKLEGTRLFLGHGYGFGNQAMDTSQPANRPTRLNYGEAYRSL